MDWIRLHPYSSALAVAGALIVVGALIVGERTPVAPAPAVISWAGTGGSLLQSQSGAPQSEAPQTIAQQVIQNPLPTSFTSPASVPAPTPAPVPAGPSGPFDYETLIAELTASTKNQSGAQASTSLSTNQALVEAYQFIPQGLVATINPSKKSLTPTQQALYDYGNDLGSSIQSFERENPDQAQVLKNQAEDRTDPGKAAALVALGRNLAAVGTEMENMSDVPPEVATLNTNLGQSYVSIGTKLQAIPNAQTDAQFIQAIEDYDSAADQFTRNYAALAEYFTVAGVTFSTTDTGSEFSFTNSSGL